MLYYTQYTRKTFTLTAAISVLQMLCDWWRDRCIRVQTDELLLLNTKLPHRFTLLMDRSRWDSNHHPHSNHPGAHRDLYHTISSSRYAPLTVHFTVSSRAVSRRTWTACNGFQCARTHLKGGQTKTWAFHLSLKMLVFDLQGLCNWMKK